jgi:hypothetical protein
MANDAFAALAHPTRREIVERLSGGAATVGEPGPRRVEADHPSAPEEKSDGSKVSASGEQAS